MITTTTRRTTTTLLALLLLAASSILHAQEVPSGYEESWANVQVPGYTQKEMTIYLHSDSVAFLPLADVLGILRSRVELTRNGSLYTGHLSEDQEFSINLVDRTLITMRGSNLFDTVAIDRTHYFQTDIDLFVRDSLLSAALGTNVSFSLEELKVTIAVSNRLPVVNYIGRKSLWSQLRKPGDSLTVRELDYSFQRMLIGSAALRWESHGLLARNSGQSRIRQNFGGSLGLTMPLLFGQFNIGGYLDNGAVSGQESKMSYGMSSWSWAFAVPDFPGLSEVNLFGRTFSQNVGIRLTNAAMGFHPETIVDTISGIVGSRDVVELHTTAGLIGATQADTNGVYRFFVPRASGRVSYRTIAINQYEEKSYDQFTFGNEFIGTTPGTFEYTATGVLDSLTMTSRADGVAGLRVGLTNWLELGANAQAFSKSIKDIGSKTDSSFLVTGISYSLRAAILHDLGVDLSYEQVHDRGGIGLTSGFFPRIPISVAVQNIRPRHKDSIFSDLGVSVSTGFSESIFSTYLSGNYSKRNVEMRTGLGIFLGDIAFSSDATLSMPLLVEGESTETQTRTTNRRPLVPNRLNLLGIQSAVTFSFKHFPTMQLMTFYDHGTGKLSSVEVQTSVELFSDISMTASLRVPQQDFSRILARIGLSWATGPITGRSGFVADKSFQQITTSIGGTAFIGETGFELSSERYGRGSTIRLLAFNDRNGNGIQDDGEEDLRNPMGILVRNMVGDVASQPSDEYGVFLSVPEYEDITVDVDRWSLADDEFYPAKREFGVYMAQGFQRVINVPFQRGFTVEGTCRIERPNLKGGTASTTQGLNSMRIWLESATGIGVYDGEMFDDGTVLILGVPVGEYRVRMDPAQLAYRRIMLQDGNPSVVITEDQHQVPEIILVPVTSTETSPTQERDE